MNDTALPTLTLTLPSDREIVMTRVVTAPRRLVWEAWTNPVHLPHWMLGPSGWSMPVCEIDLRLGGAWHFAWRSAEGAEMEMRGVYQEITPPERLVSTEAWGGDWPETRNTLMLTEEAGKTTITIHIVYASPQARDAALKIGMERGVATSFDNLEAYLSTQGHYVQVNGLKMYYEVHGVGRPLVLLHGAFGTAEGWGGILSTLAKTHQVIVVELQGHGHTGDIERPLSSEHMADDVAALLQHLEINEADVFGYSMGGGVALALAIRHPDLVRKLAILGAKAGASKDTFDPETYKIMKSITPENFNFPQVKDPYTRVAPDPSKWPTLVAKIIQMDEAFKGFATKEVQAIQAQTLIMLGDHDGVRPEHAVEMFRLIPHAQLAIFPAGDHFFLFLHPEKVLSTLMPFLESPVPERKKDEAEQAKL